MSEPTLPESSADWTTDGVLAYLDGRVRQVLDLPNRTRPRWTVQDVQAVAYLRGAYLESRRLRAAA